MATDLETAEASFTKMLLCDPSDETARKVFADWLDDHYPERRVQAKYLREIKKQKFIRLVRNEGSWALYPQWAEDRGKRVFPALCYDTIEDRIRKGTADASPRFIYWQRRIRRGWKVPKHIKSYGYSMACEWFGVYVSEYTCVLSRMLQYH